MYLPRTSPEIFEMLNEQRWPAPSRTQQMSFALSLLRIYFCCSLMTLLDVWRMIGLYPDLQSICLR